MDQHTAIGTATERSGTTRLGGGPADGQLVRGLLAQLNLAFQPAAITATHHRVTPHPHTHPHTQTEVGEGVRTQKSLALVSLDVHRVDVALGPVHVPLLLLGDRPAARLPILAPQQLGRCSPLELKCLYLRQCPAVKLLCWKRRVQRPSADDLLRLGRRAAHRLPRHGGTRQPADAEGRAVRQQNPTRVHLFENAGCVHPGEPQQRAVPPRMRVREAAAAAARCSSRARAQAAAARDVGLCVCICVPIVAAGGGVCAGGASQMARDLESKRAGPGEVVDEPPDDHPH